MAKKYLKGSSLESDETKRKARILGIAHEIYVNHTEAIGGDYNINNATKYATSIYRQKDTEGTLYNDWAYEIDTESAEYGQMIQIHKDLLVDTLTGWDLT